MSAVAVYVHLAGREPVRLSGRAAFTLVGVPRMLGVAVLPSPKVSAELVKAGIYDQGTERYTALGRRVAAVLAGEVRS